MARFALVPQRNRVENMATPTPEGFAYRGRCWLLDGPYDLLTRSSMLNRDGSAWAHRRPQPEDVLDWHYYRLARMRLLTPQRVLTMLTTPTGRYRRHGSCSRPWPAFGHATSPPKLRCTSPSGSMPRAQHWPMRGIDGISIEPDRVATSTTRTKLFGHRGSRCRTGSHQPWRGALRPASESAPSCVWPPPPTIFAHTAPSSARWYRRRDLFRASGLVTTAAPAVLFGDGGRRQRAEGAIPPGTNRPIAACGHAPSALRRAQAKLLRRWRPRPRPRTSASSDGSRGKMFNMRSA